MPRRATAQARRALYEEATAIIALEYDEPLELPELARRLASSPRQLQRAFTEAGQTTFRRHLCAARMAQAARLLAQGEAVAKVAASVGYREPAQFAKAFRRHHGCTPSDYAGASTDSGPPSRASAPSRRARR